MRCDKCGHISASLNMTPAEFKELFKVGDTITCWSTELPATITAIGDTKILYYSEWEKESKGNKAKERVASMRNKWRKVKENPND